MAEKKQDSVTDTGKARTMISVPFKLPEDGEILEHLEIMVKEQASDNAKFLRWLIEKEWNERQHVRRGTDKFKKALIGQHQKRQPGQAARP
jgi:hypothetical protein